MVDKLRETNWHLVHISKKKQVELNIPLREFEVLFPDITLEGQKLPAYVRLTTLDNKQSAYLKASPWDGASGVQVFVPEGILKEIREESRVLFDECSRFRFRLYRLLKDPIRLLALIGMIMTLGGILIDKSLVVGKSTPLFTVAPITITVIVITASLLQVIGLTVGFFKEMVKEE